ncbi:MAG: chromosome segregation protein SMC [Fimbriiglobus sp.]
MLKRLEILGFKSFAERTRFDFAPGITAIVGPNGSGKSNIVDAVRWILGEQSAKNLRGTDMTDVIFNGSSTRKSLGMAEVTMTFDNTSRTLDHPSEEVTITRRVYRDGQGEYLVNSEPSRLKDIKELFLGSGAGHGAYSVIEQGRVDALLTSSPKDRRLIFEEAAGISRFKAKKLETLRKLERVETDLIRVNDILGELGKQLQGLRHQASKALKHQEYQDQLRDLRLSVGLVEYRTLTADLTTETTRLTGIQSVLAAMSEDAKTGESDQAQLDAEWQKTHDALETRQGELAKLREQLVQWQATIKADRANVASWDEELLRLGRERIALGERARTLSRDIDEHGSQLDFAEKRASAETERAAALEVGWVEIQAKCKQLETAIKKLRDQQLSTVSAEATARNLAESTKRTSEKTASDCAWKERSIAETKLKLAALRELLANLSENDSAIQQRVQEMRAHIEARKQERAVALNAAAEVQARLDAERQARTTAVARRDALADWEASHEGLGTGVRAILEKLAAGDSAWQAAVYGLVSDQLRAPRELAHLVDIALGERAEAFVVKPGVSLETIAELAQDLPGRVAFVARRGPVSPVQFPGDRPPPICLAGLVESDVSGLTQTLLGSVYLVSDLAAAQEATTTTSHCHWLTHSGLMLQADGVLSLGPTEANRGRLSRKTELRELRDGVEKRDAIILALETEATTLRHQASELEGPIRTLQTEVDALSGEAGGLREKIIESRSQEKTQTENLELYEVEWKVAADQRDQAKRKAEEALAVAVSTATEAQRVQAELEARLTELQAAEAEREVRGQEHNQAQMTLVRMQEQLKAFRKKKTELDELASGHEGAIAELASQEQGLRHKRQTAELRILRLTMNLAQSMAEKETGERVIRELTERRQLIDEARQRLSAALKESLAAAKTNREAAHTSAMTKQSLELRAEQLVSRLREEFAVDLVAHAEAHPEAAAPPEDAAAQIETLRAKITKLGSVNYDSITELRELETREQELRAQFDDLNSGHKTLQQIIDQINTDSRKLFGDLLAVVRGHFQELFRKVFSGGKADIVLENETDILESGIEITAHPPGKQPQSISLLSGGERALTAAALLLAIFRSKPSPFCLLDEIDAAMDEANTQRLANLIGEFRERTQFIVITHKKRTMAQADVLHGVTMQESGVSKLIAVRFEDWPDDQPETLPIAA